MSIHTLRIVLCAFYLTSTAAKKCHTDNCLREVLTSTERASIDCSSYLLKTVEPIPPTATFVSYLDFTVTTTLHVPSHQVKRNAPTAPRTASRPDTYGHHQQQHLPHQTPTNPTDIPLYASACVTAPSAYSSACTCLGVSRSTTTLPISTVYITVNNTVFSTRCETPQPTFLARVNDTACVFEDDSVAPGGGALIGVADNNCYPVVYSGTTLLGISTEGTLILVSDRRLVFNVDPARPFELVRFDPVDVYESLGRVAPVCTQIDGVVQCYLDHLYSSEGWFNFVYCPNVNARNDLFTGGPFPENATCYDGTLGISYACDSFET